MLTGVSSAWVKDLDIFPLPTKQICTKSLFKLYLWTFKALQVESTGSELIAQLVITPPTGRDRDERHGFEARSDHQILISKLHMVLYKFAPSFYMSVLRTGHWLKEMGRTR